MEPCAEQRRRREAGKFKLRPKLRPASGIGKGKHSRQKCKYPLLQKIHEIRNKARANRRTNHDCRGPAHPQPHSAPHPHAPSPHASSNYRRSDPRPPPNNTLTWSTQSSVQRTRHAPSLSVPGGSHFPRVNGSSREPVPLAEPPPPYAKILRALYEMSDYDSYADGTGQLPMFGEETQPRTLYVGNLDIQMTEEFLLVLFSQIGQVKGCKIIQEVVLVAAFAVCTVSGVFWNSRPKVVRVRLRPTRNHGPVTAPHHHHQPHHRIHNPSPFPSHRHRSPPPHHNEPIKSYRHPGSSHGSMFLNQHEGHMPPSPPFQQQHQSHSTHTHRPMPSHKNVEPEQFFHHRPGFNKHASPISNLVDHSEFKTPSDSNQHGYLSPTYTGWKPISKPFQLKAYEAQPTSVKSDYYVYPSTEAYHDQDGKHQKLILNTLFRDNVKHIKPLKPVKLKQDYTSHDVTIPLPSEVGEIVRLPSSLFFDNPVHSYYHPFHNIATSQSEDKPVIQKPFPKFQPRPKPSTSHSESNSNGAEATTASPPKFKISRPKLRTPVQSQYNNEPEVEGLGHSSLPKPVLPKAVKPHQHHHSASPQHSQQQETLTVKPKFTKVRTRVRVKEARPEGYVNTEDLSQVISYRPSGQTPVTSRTPGETRIPYAHPEHSTHTPSRPSNIHFGNQTFTVSPLDPPHSPDFSTYSYPEFMRGFDGDKQGQRYVGGPTITEGPNQRIPEGHGVEMGGSKAKVVEKPRGGNGERKKRPKHHHKNIASPVVHNESPVYPEEFYMPPGFIQSQSLGGHNHNPVSFMTMPNSQPQVIHHAVHNGHSPSQSQQHLYPINVIRSPEPHRPEHSHHGTSPNGNYAQNNRPPFVFMNAQNGRTQPFRHADPETPTFPPPTYETSVVPQPFHHSNPPYPSSAPFKQSSPSNQPHPTSPVPFQLVPASTPSSSGRPQYQLSSNNAGHYHSIPDNQPHQPYNLLHGQTSQHNPIFEFVNAQNPKGNLEAYASSEYEQIPMEFMNHLRPILLESDGYQGPVLTSSSTSHHHTFYPSESVNQDYFNNFFKFKPMEESSATPAEGRVKTYVLGHSGETGGNSGYDNYRAASNYEVRVVKPELQNTNTVTRQAVSQIPQLSVSPLHEYSIVTTVSPIHDIEFFNSKSPKKWSKLKLSAGGLSSTESYGASTYKYKKLIGKANETTPQPTERTRAPTTPSSLISTSLTPSKPTPSDSVEASYSNPSPLVVKSPLPTPSSSEDDSSDTNIPSSVRLRTTATTPKSSSPKPGFSSSPQISGSTTNSYSRRPFRRRRPGLMARRKFFSSRLEAEEKGKDDPPVTTHRPRRLLLSPSTTARTQHENEEVSTSTDGDGFESSRLALKPRRRNYNRNVNVQSRRGYPAAVSSDGFKSATPSAAEPEHVTYGESQWFRVKESADTEGEKPTLNSPNGKTSEKYPSSVEGDGHHGGEISFSSKILSTTPHAKLEPLETSSESLAESKSLSTKNFYESDSPGVSPHEVGGKVERNDSSGARDVMSL